MIELKKLHYFFEATILSSPSDIVPLKSTNFSKQEFMENVYLYVQEVSLLRLLYLKLIII